MSLHLVSADGQAANIERPVESTAGRGRGTTDFLARHGKNYRRPTRATMARGARGAARGNGRGLDHQLLGVRRGGRGRGSSRRSRCRRGRCRRGRCRRRRGRRGGRCRRGSVMALFRPGRRRRGRGPFFRLRCRSRGRRRRRLSSPPLGALEPWSASGPATTWSASGAAAGSSWWCGAPGASARGACR